MNDIKLKACPFCGGEAMTEEVDANGAIRKSIGCHTEGCHGYQSTQTYSTYREAAKAWNVRAGDREQEAKLNDGDIAGSLKQPGSASPSKQPIRANGVLIPADYSFEAINNFVHATPSPEYEELQWALLGIAASLEKAATCEARPNGEPSQADKKT